MFQLRNVVDPETREIIKNTNRKTRPMVRRLGASEWEDITWDDAVAEIAQWVKKTRDETFETMHDGITVNRCHGIASLDVYKRQVDTCPEARFAGALGAALCALELRAERG